MHQINDLIDIKNKNIKSILNQIRFHPCTKKHIAASTNLSFATVSNLCNELKDMGILTESKIDGKRVGRIPDKLSLNSEKNCIVALDLQLENLLGFAIVNLENQIIFEQSYDISSMNNAQEVVCFAKQLLDNQLANHMAEDLTFIGIGAAVPAVFDSKNNLLVFSALSIYEGIPLKEMLENVFGIPAYIDNLTNIRAFSIHTHYPEKQNIICLDISQGVGVGIIAEGNLLRGKNGYATEIAHIPLGNPQYKCSYCGGLGCIENELSISNMTSCIPEINPSLPLIQRWNCFVEEMKTYNERTEEIARNIGGLTGKLATMLINLFDPEVFFISGYITDIFYRFEPYFRAELELRCKMALNRDLRIIIENNTNTHLDIYTGLCDIIFNIWNPLNQK